MRKSFIGLVFFFVIVGLSANLYASDTLGNFSWQLSHVTNLQNQEITFDRNILSLDVDFGSTYLNVYGTLSDRSGIDAQAVVGSGYLYINEYNDSTIRMEVRAGTYLYNLKLDAQTLSGMVGIYDKDGHLFAGGSIDFLGLNLQSF